MSAAPKTAVIVNTMSSSSSHNATGIIETSENTATSELPSWETKRKVFTLITSQTFLGLSGTGLFYGWGAFAEYINMRFNPEDPFSFRHQHGIFGAVIILVCSSGPMPLFQAYFEYINKNPVTNSSSSSSCIKIPRISEKTLHLIAVFMVIGGFFLAGISLQFRMIWLYYVGCCVPSGLGGVIIYRRCVFNHQLWYKSIDLVNIGSGLFGFIIGLWTVIFFLITVPLILKFPIEQVFYIYAAGLTPLLLFPAITISDSSIPGATPVPVVTTSLSSPSPSSSSSSPSPPSSFNHYSALKSSDEEANVTEVVGIVNKTGDTKSCSDIMIDINCVLPQILPTTTTASTTTSSSSTTTITTVGTRGFDLNNMSDEDLKVLFDKYKIAYFYVQRSSKIPPSIFNIFKTSVESDKKIDKMTSSHNHHNHQWVFEYPISSYDALFIPEQWMVTIFFTTILTPGWGIKLSAISMLLKTFEVTFVQAAVVATVYVSLYAFGRLISGFVAETRLGVFYTYYIIILVMMALLLVLPSTSTSAIPHIGFGSRGCEAFMWCIWIIGLLYGGGVALFYSIVMELFGVKNYKSVFSVTVVGFSFSCAIGGLSSAYSFSKVASQSVAEQQTVAATWYYCMAAACFISFIILLTIQPYNYKGKLIDKLREKMTEEGASASLTTTCRSDTNKSSTLKLESPPAAVTPSDGINSLSSRANPFFKPAYPYIIAQITARGDIYDARNNSKGKLPFAIAENKLCHDLLLAKVNSFSSNSGGYSKEVFNYTNPTGHPIHKEAMASFLSKYLFSGHKIKPEHLVISPGCCATLHQLSLLLFEKGDTILLPTPYYPAFVGDFFNIGSVNIFDVHNKSYLSADSELNIALDIDSLEIGYRDAVNKGHRVRGILLCNPNNPLGIVYSNDELKAAIAWARGKGLFIICDEIYALSCFEESSFTSVVTLLNNELSNDVFVLWSLSKDFGASGLRLGALYCQNELLLRALSGSNDAFQVSNLIQEMTTFLLQDEVFINKFITTNRNRLKDCFDRLKSGLGSLGFNTIDSACGGIFAFVDFRPLLSERTFEAERELSSKFIENGLIFTPGEACHCPIPGYFRICYAWLGDVRAIAELVTRVRGMALSRSVR